MSLLLFARSAENKKVCTPKRRKSVHAEAGSPPAVGASGTSSKSGRLGVPLSERQQVALIMQQYGKNDVTPSGGKTTKRTSFCVCVCVLFNRLPLTNKDCNVACDVCVSEDCKY